MVDLERILPDTPEVRYIQQDMQDLANGVHSLNFIVTYIPQTGNLLFLTFAFILFFFQIYLKTIQLNSV